MAVYEFTAPDGKTYEVEGSGTPEQALAHLQQQLAAGAAREYSLSGRGADAGVLEQLGGGAKHAWDRAALGLKGMFTDLTPEDRALLAQGRQFVQATGPASSVGEIGGDVLLTAAPAARAATAVRAGARMLPQALQRVGRLAGNTAAAAGIGAAVSPEDRSGGAVAGAAGNVIGAGLQRAAGGVLAPLVSREGRELMRQGIQPTPGQAIGGMATTLEQKAMSVPIVGDLIGRGRQRAVREWNEALIGQVANRADGASGTAVRAAARQLGGSGDEALLGLRDRIGDIYETVLDKVPSLRIAPDPIRAAVREIADDPALGLSKASIERLNDYAEKHLLGHGSDITGRVAKRIESDLGKAAYRFQTGTVGEDAAYGEALKRLHTAWRGSLESALPTAERAALADANAAWRGLVQLDKAAAAAPSQARGGVFTPRVLRQAMAALDRSESDNVLRGLRMNTPQAVGQTPYEYAAAMTRAGQALGDTVPDSGTAGRLLANVAGGGAAAAGGAALGALPQILAGLGTVGAAYSRIGSRLLTQGVAPDATERLLRFAAQHGVPEDELLAQFPNVLRAIAQHESQGQ